MTEGIPDISEIAAYRAARQPQSISVGLANVATDGGSLANSPALAALAGPRQLAPALRDGLSEHVSLVGSALSGRPQPAAVLLQYGLDQAGQRVWVQPVDGGKVNGSTGGRFVAISPAGTLAFSFEAPARSDSYKLILRLDNVETVLPFVVPDPTELLRSAGSPATPTATVHP